MIAENLANLNEGRSPRSHGRVSHAEAASLMDVSLSAIKRVRKVRRDGAPELQASMETGTVTTSAAGLGVEDSAPSASVPSYIHKSA